MSRLHDDLRELCGINGCAGDESRVRDAVVSRIPQGYAHAADPLGNLIVKSQAIPHTNIVYSAHMDEVAFIATSADDDGFLRFINVGGISPSAALGKTVVFCASKFGADTPLFGVVGHGAYHLLKDDDADKQPKLDELFIDIGVSSKEEAEALVSPGDIAYFASEFSAVGDATDGSLVRGKAIDDRLGCAVLLELMRRGVAGTFVFTVQEEVGARGAQAAAFLLKPEVSVVIESTTACDVPEVSGAKQICKFNEGAVVSFMDGGTVYDRQLYKSAFELAEKHNIKIQPKTAATGGNDSRAFQRGGARCIAISAPTRYLHTASNIISLDDLDAVCDLAEKICEIV